MGRIILICLLLLNLWPRHAKAQFSTDAPILLDILANNISQLYQLYEMVHTAHSNLQLMQEISQGIDQALSLYLTIKAPKDPGLYREWQNVGQALRGLEKLYGSVSQSKEEAVQRDLDKGVAEAISLNNKVYDYTNKLDQIGDRIEQHSHSTSPKGAQRLTAQSLGILLQAENQSIRTHAAQLKLQAQALALENHRAKEQTKQVLHETSTLKAAMQKSRTEFKTPRF